MQTNTNITHFYFLHTKLTVLGRYSSQQSNQSFYDGDIFSNKNSNDTNLRSYSNHDLNSSSRAGHNDENGNVRSDNSKKPPIPPPLPPVTPNPTRSGTMKSLTSEIESYQRQSSQNLSSCKQIFFFISYIIIFILQSTKNFNE